MKLFNITIDEFDETGMNFISLVEDPAVMIDFIKFNNEQIETLKFDNLKHIISGVVCLADTPIYRFDKKHGEYYVQFSKDTIEKMMVKYSKMGLNNSVDLQHNGKPVDGVIMLESFLINKDRGICPNEFKNIPDGSWIASFKVENKEIWNEIINGNTLNGFSLSGKFQLEDIYMNELKEENKEQTLEDFIDEIIK